MGSVRVVAITSGTSYTIPADFVSLISVECLGAGGNGNSSGGAGAGGCYALGTTNTFTSLAANASITVQAGVAGGTVGNRGSIGTADTIFNDLTHSDLIFANGGSTTASSSGGTPGSLSVGETTHLGGTGGSNGGGGGGGGGGAAGLNGTGGNGTSGTGPGAPGGAGDNGSGGAAGTSGGGAGGNGSEWTLTAGGTVGSGGGGGGGLNNGGNGGSYGAGGGGTETAHPAGNGTNGIIIFTYNSSISPSLSLPPQSLLVM